MITNKQFLRNLQRLINKMTYKYKSVYLLIIVGFVAGIYLISCYLTGLLKGRNFRIN